MTERIKFRLTAAKASVTLAFLALVGGLVGPAQGSQGAPNAKAASFSWGDPIYIKFSGVSGATKQAFLKFEFKLNQALGSLSHKINTSFYDKHKIDATFLKIDQANKIYYKEQDVNANFLKINDANANFLKINDANAEFLKIVDASNEFLKLDATAANANKLGGLTPDAFVQGHANVVSGQASIADGATQPLLQSPDGAITVKISVDKNGNQSLVMHNGTPSDLTAVFDPTAVEKTLPAGSDFTLPLNNVSAGAAPVFSPTMTHVQIFPGGTLRDVMTLTVSTETPVNGTSQAVGQMLIGLL